MVGTLAHVKLVILLHGMVGVLLILGVQTRVAAIAAWWLHRSLGMRAPFVLAKDGELGELMLLWGTVLPLGAVWSVDHWHGARLPGRNRNPGLLSHAIMWLFDPDAEADDARADHAAGDTRKVMLTRPDSVWADRAPNGRAKQQPRAVVSSAGPVVGNARRRMTQRNEYISCATVGIHFQGFFQSLRINICPSSIDF